MCLSGVDVCNQGADVLLCYEGANGAPGLGLIDAYSESSGVFPGMSRSQAYVFNLYSTLHDQHMCALTDVDRDAPVQLRTRRTVGRTVSRC